MDRFYALIGGMIGVAIGSLIAYIPPRTPLRQENVSQEEWQQLLSATQTVWKLKIILGCLIALASTLFAVDFLLPGYGWLQF